MAPGYDQQSDDHETATPAARGVCDSSGHSGGPAPGVPPKDSNQPARRESRQRVGHEEGQQQVIEEVAVDHVFSGFERSRGRTHGRRSLAYARPRPAATARRTMIQVSNVNHRFGERAVLTGHKLEHPGTSRWRHRCQRIGQEHLRAVAERSSDPRQRQPLSWTAWDTREDVKAVRRRVGFVFQNPDNQIVFPWLKRTSLFGLKNLKLPKHEIAQKVDTVLAKYGLTHLRDQAAHLLSGGEKQLLAISAVLVMEAPVCGVRRAYDLA